MPENPYFFEIHSDLPREGPGSDSSTRKALALVPALPTTPDIADLGCGPGRAALILARETDGKITALDIHQPFLGKLRERAHEENLQHKISTVQGDMTALPFEPDTFDLIWSEGAIYIIGMEKGLRTWRPLLKNNGCLAFSHISWTKETPAAAAHTFWSTAYPSIRHTAENIRTIEQEGFKVIQHFTLPANDWWDEYYAVMEQRITNLREKHPNDVLATSACDESQKEIDLWKDHGNDYGYVFYIAEKI